MIICGLKLTHDGAIALIDNGELIFSYEMEKLDNRPRYSEFSITIEEMEELLLEKGYSLDQVDRIVIDGWDRWDVANLYEEQIIKPDFLRILSSKGKDIVITKLADYGRVVGENEDVLEGLSLSSQEGEISYNSYQHVTGHILGTYCTSPFAKEMADSYVLVWDGGMPPQLFYYSPKEKKARSLGQLFPFMGYVYVYFSLEYEPFNALKSTIKSLIKENISPANLPGSIAGKAMAYMALGNVDPDILSEYKKIYAALLENLEGVDLDVNIVAIFSERFIAETRKYCTLHGLDDRDMMATFHVFIQDLLLENLAKKVKENPEMSQNLCYAGGCALNIKWNNHIRESGIFEDVWVPPFPNDAGSALGTACCEMVMNDNIQSLNWNVYSGPALNDVNADNPDYTAEACSLEELAYILHTTNEPIVFLNGAAELGPRALGNRSILAAAVDPDMKNELNRVKGRESYRPVAPICLEEYAAEVFNPGKRDPYMIFEHWVKDSWKDKVPAICHLDGTARVQTVNKDQNPSIYELLTHYKKLSGVPLLCNTSANHSGKGFFPDVKSVMDWGGVKYIWSEGKIFIAKGKLSKQEA